jgi:glycosyltransferase involved in cell wall biosynthesis
MTTPPLVSVCCVTYNHEQYIKDAIEGFLIQETHSPYEIIIHDDCSTDGTAEIIRDYQQKHPDLITTILQTENQRSKGKKIFPITFERARGKYIALCEGDDYWTDPHKLQKQVEFLEAHQDCVICCTKADLLDQLKEEIQIGVIGPPGAKQIYTLNDVLEFGGVCPTLTTLFRNGLISDFPKWFFECAIGDYPLEVLLSSFGMIGFLDLSTAVYRVHRQGVWSGSSLLQNQLALIKTHHVIGRNLKLGNRASFKKGANRFHRRLAYLYKKEGQY